jgi:hypothetical protein
VKLCECCQIRPPKLTRSTVCALCAVDVDRLQGKGLTRAEAVGVLRRVA